VRQEHHRGYEHHGKDQLDTYGEIIIGAVNSFGGGDLQKIQWVHQGIVLNAGKFKAYVG
jgi:hypothetical protein